jgi:hypothetical protein
MRSRIFTFYGRKRRLAPKYSKPLHDTLIEPFAGSAAYSLHGDYWQKNVILIEKDPLLFNLWKWLQSIEPADMLALPMVPHGTTTRDHLLLTEPERHFLGFMIAAGPSRPQMASSTMSSWTENHRARIASDLYKIKHWDIRNDTYENAPDIEASWFIDPPYQFGGQHYRMSNKLLDFGKLADWCQSRKGQVTVCENTKATWLPFQPFAVMNGQLHNTTEAIWYNENGVIGWPPANAPATVISTPPKRNTNRKLRAVPKEDDYSI